MEEKPLEWYENQPLMIEALENGYLNLCELNTTKKKYSLDGGDSWNEIGKGCSIFIEKGEHIMVTCLANVYSKHIGVIRTTSLLVWVIGLLVLVVYRNVGQYKMHKKGQ